MTDTQKQAAQRFLATLIAEVVTLIVGALSNPELAQVIVAFTGEGSLLTTLILALLPPLVLALGKLQAGPTEKAVESDMETTRGGARRRRVVGEGPGLFG